MMSTRAIAASIGSLKSGITVRKRAVAAASPFEPNQRCLRRNSINGPPSSALSTEMLKASRGCAPTRRVKGGADSTIKPCPGRRA